MITLITGGSRSGKSEYAENILKGKDDTVYIATAEITDYEMRNRVQCHIARRNSAWRTFEAYRSLKDAVGTEKNYLLDCVTNLSSRILFEKTGGKETVTAEDIQNTVSAAVSEITALISAVRKVDANLIIVTNEVGLSIVPMNNIARAFCDTQGYVNTELASIADSVVLIICGLPVILK